MLNYYYAFLLYLKKSMRKGGTAFGYCSSVNGYETSTITTKYGDCLNEKIHGYGASTAKRINQHA